jgi:WD40 repeat protein
MDARFNPEQTWLALSVSTTPGRADAPQHSEAGSGNLQLWDFRAGRRLGDPISLPSEPRGLAVHPSGRWIGVFCQAGQGVEVDVTSRRPKTLIQDACFHAANAILANGLCAYSPDGRLFVLYGAYQFLHLWDRDRERDLIEPFRLDQNTFDVDFFGTTLAGAVVTMSSRVEFLDLVTGKSSAPALPYSNWPLRVQFSPDGKLLLTAGVTRVGQVWDWRTGRLVCPALPHDDQIMGATFIPGKPWVATGGHDGLIKFWDYRTGMAVAPPIQRPGWVLQLKITPDGRTLAASGFMSQGIELIDLDHLLPEPDLTPADAKLLAEIEAAAEVHPGGDLVPLTTEAWLARWATFRRQHAGFADHQLR